MPNGEKSRLTNNESVYTYNSGSLSVLIMPADVVGE